jgi:hypothetical protein
MSSAGESQPPLPGSQTTQSSTTTPPGLAAPFEPVRSSQTSQTSQTSTPTPRIIEGDADDGKGKDKKKRNIFGFGKKKSSAAADDASLSSQPSGPPPPAKDRPARKPTEPIQTDNHHAMLPSSPGRGGGLSSSPRLSSPAGSQIFERDVQETVAATTLPNSPAIPNHIATENYIPPVLDASSEAITADGLDPDSVEIITHSGHQPAAVTVTGASSPYDAMSASWADELASSFAGDSSYGAKDDAASNYGSFDTTDVRRLSFISFADVVQAEQQQQVTGSRDSMHLAGLTSLGSLGLNRSPSPIRSPISSQGGASPPASKSGSVKGLEMSPVRKPLGSPATSAVGHTAPPTVTGEIAIETMSQALRRTGSADLSAVRSLPTSPIEGPSR